MVKVKNIAKYIEKLAPLDLAESWDNPGLMVGDAEQEVGRLYIALDATTENVNEAISLGADMIVTHHPLIFTSISHVTEQDVCGSIIMRLVKNDISVYSAHTNLDIADGGMNDILCEKLDIIDTRHFTDEECRDGNGKPLMNIGRVGTLKKPTEFYYFLEFVKDALGCEAISYTGNLAENITTAAVCSGSGGDLIYNAYNAGADVYITSEVKHHEAQLALELGMNLIDAGHFETENTICDFMEEYLGSRFPEIEIFKSSAKPYKRRN